MMTNRLDSLPCDMLDLVYDFVGRKNLAPIAMMQTILTNEDYHNDINQELNKKFNMQYLKAEFEDKKYHKFVDEETDDNVEIRNEIIKKVINARFELNITPLWKESLYVSCCRGFANCLHYGDRLIRFTMCEEELHAYVEETFPISDMLNEISHYDTNLLMDCAFNKEYNGYHLDNIISRVDGDDEILQLMFDIKEVMSVIFDKNIILGSILGWNIEEMERIDDGTILIMDEEEL
jgi:hypothetical protein